MRLLAAVLLVLAACTALSPERGYSPPDPVYSCVLPVSPLGSARDTAVACAEEFVARNGYTDLAPTVDSSTVAYESLEFSVNVAARLAGPTSSLERRAVGICDGAGRGPGYTVVFRPPGPAEAEQWARAVTMTLAFTDLRMQHRNFRIAYLDSLHGTRCTRFR